MFVYDNKLWTVGGSYFDFGLELIANNVWSSTDGVNWTQVNTSSPFNTRLDPQYFVYNNRLWMTGVNLGNKVNFNDIWSTTDGVTWTEENSSAAFSPRSQNPVVELNGQFYMLGGYKWTDTFYNDIWTSADGVSWCTPQQQTVNFP